MPLTHTKELFAKALKGKYALGAFNVNNMELLQAIVEACEEEKAPVMLQISKGAGVDSLAVAIGNSHGAYKFKGEQHLDLERLKAIKAALMDAGLGDYPLVLHGASSVPKQLVEEINQYGGKLGVDAAGVPEADIEIARRVGCTKVNIDTDLRLAMTAGIRKAFAENPKEFDPRKYLSPARTKVKELVRHKVRNVLCCAGHAFD